MNAESTPLIFQTAALSHQGCVRSHNEDNYVALPELGLWVVADGMGGHEAGDIASDIIVQEMSSLGVAVTASDQRARFLERLDRAHHRIRAHAAEHDLDTVGTTVAALMVFGAELSCAWAGDSRIYLLRDRVLTAMTRDHSEVATLLAEGTITPEEARSSPRRNVITRAIGIGSAPQPEVVTGVARPGDRFLICSDGLTEHLTDEDLTYVLGAGRDAQQAAEHLVGMTLERGAKDNVTVVVIDAAAAGDDPDEGG
ncbi:PP2C family protein-serine/threonine phosphatase [Paracoccus xiamenensis]|uniref:PP2C family protein-serine/threonine phosphatase n=1 Tax=Paracoccus xiamenensis TaxID=2714901 RepID=UPI00140B96C7|nr:protein phosphatase 2C domain-containing protein [Paracoccus xiamenensis]NHF73854.1 serine/threonine-protein phosphatase [Paracoccus xiamenensis]